MGGDTQRSNEMKPYLKPEVLYYLQKNRKRYFYDETGKFRRRKCEIDYRTFCRALKLLPIEIDTAYRVLEILDVPQDKMPKLIEWK